MTQKELSFRHASPEGAETRHKQRHGLFSLPGTKWRAALGALAGAPVRLHHYRNFHTEVIEDALRAYDCGSHR
jgi:hypothetical protein